MSDLDAIKFLLDGSYRGAESKFKNQIKLLKQENETLKNRVADLEAKLAESEERINWLVEAEFNRKWAKKYVEMRRKEDPMLCLPDSDEVYERYFELKQQLTEKEKESLKYFNEYRVWKNKCELLEQDQNKILENNQAKISFAVEQLEKVKEFFLKEERDEEMDTDYVITKENWEIADFLLDQIKAIKGEK